MASLTAAERSRVLSKGRIAINWPLLVFALGAGLRLYSLGTDSYWLDEVVMLRTAAGSVQSILHEAAYGGGRPPVFVLLAHYWMQSFGTSEAATRLLPALAGIAAVPLMYVVGRQLFGRRVALVSTLLMAISEFQINQSQNFRYYSLFLLVTLLSYLTIIQGIRNGKRRYLVLYVPATIVLFFTHSYGVFVIAAQNLFFVLLLLYRWRRYRPLIVPWLACQLLIAAAVGPGIWFAFSEASTGSANPQQWIPDPALWAPVVTVGKYVYAGSHFPSLLILALAIAVLAIGTVLLMLRSGGAAWLNEVKALTRMGWLRSPGLEEAILVGCWFICPIAIPFVLSKVFGPMYVHRYTIAASPAWYLMLALALTSLRKIVPELVSLLAIAILIAPGMVQYYSLPHNEQWREMAAYIEQNEKTGDVLVFAPGEDGALHESLSWYYTGDLRGCDLDVRLQRQDEIATALSSCLSGAPRFWLILRGYPERIKYFTTFFLDSPSEDMRIAAKEQYTEVSLYLFTLTTEHKPKTSLGSQN